MSFWSSTRERIKNAAFLAAIVRQQEEELLAAAMEEALPMIAKMASPAASVVISFSDLCRV
jgi:hypothetical protein